MDENKLDVTNNKVDTLTVLVEDVKYIKDKISTRFLDTELGIWCIKFSAFIFGVALLALIVI